MAPVRLAAGAVFALSGAASWLLPDPWTPPPQTCNADFNENPACAPESEGASSAPLPAPPPPGSGATTCDAELGGCTVGPVAATSSPSATRSSTARSAASPFYWGRGPAALRTAEELLLPPPSDPGNDSGIRETSLILGSTKVGNGCCGLYGHGADNYADASAPQLARPVTSWSAAVRSSYSTGSS